MQPPRYHHQSRQLPSGMGQKKVAPILQGYFNRPLAEIAILSDPTSLDPTQPNNVTLT